LGRGRPEPPARMGRGGYMCGARRDERIVWASCLSHVTTPWRGGGARGISQHAMTLDFGINTGFVEELYAQYLENPASVGSTWRDYFDARLHATQPGQAILSRAPAFPLTDGELARSLEQAFVPTAVPGVEPAGAHERDVLAEA